MRLDIGLIGATGIAERAIVGPASRRDDVHVLAVAASDPVRAREFAARNGIKRVHENYDALVRDPDINVVYVSLHNSAHHEWAVRAASQGKHVVVEKPLCLTTEEFASLESAASTHGVHVVEAIPTAGHPWQAAVREIVSAGEFGALQRIHTRIQFLPPTAGSYRTRPELGGGIFFDSASYWLQAVQSTIGLDGAIGTGESAFDGPNGTDTAFQAELNWKDGREATLDCSIGGKHIAEVEFLFTTASVRVRNLLRPVAAPLPLNLSIKGSKNEIRSFPPIAYYEAQLDRLFTVQDKPAERIALMAGIYATARGALVR
ncbi:Gfo/Idh/MocA family oxidoreductase [Kibdelosporangium philippinense]|uniref:Gfo/Idh/MocA family oxidoreductase n=1 Tax=Kibdelosporangium philippinense TaxID=211113 RepID=A0ABS8ZLM9_9PSEU|nr:Gfo/Idh/MocA family oxidoreductase [Kibdelosporangium philippinense]MCE7008477.1 Gfo/Idh/MocA family oxidoreductase [Kibdelosporangium philippinense]